MELQELYLKTVFSCMACDGDIAPEEVELVKKLASETDLFSGLDVENMINNYVISINQNGRAFLKSYLNDIAEAELNDNEQMNIVDISLLDLDEQYSAGYTLKTLAASLWCFFHSKNFYDGLYAVVNAGGDADTNAAAACAILGAKYGASSIPPYYIDHLWKRDEYIEIVRQLEKTLI